MSVDVSKLSFYTGYPIDKIITDGQLTLSVPAAPNSITPGVAVTTVSNPYGQAAFTTVSFSVDGNNFYNQNANIEYWNSSNRETLSQMTVTSACGADTIYFMATSYYTGSAQTVTINYAIDSIS